MVMVTEFKATLRARIRTAVRSVRDRLSWGEDQSVEMSTDDTADRRPVPRTVDPDELPALLEAEDIETMRVGIGRLVVVAPELPSDAAAAITTILVNRLADDEFAIQQAALRGLEAVANAYPSMVDEHAPTIASRLASIQEFVRRQCVDVMVAIVIESPARAALVYPFLDHHERLVRTAALRVLVEAAAVEPVVIATVGKFVETELESPSVDRELLVDAAVALERSHPGTMADLTPVVVDWLPAMEQSVERAAIRYLLAVDHHGEPIADRVLTALLRAIAVDAIEDRDQLVERVVALGADRTDTVATWAETRTEWERLSVAAAIDERRTDPPAMRVIEAVVRDDDRFASVIGP